MRNIFKIISRENFRSSGYIQRPKRERRTEWEYTAPPRMSINSSDGAFYRKPAKTTLLQEIRNVLSYR